MSVLRHPSTFPSRAIHLLIAFLTKLPKTYPGQNSLARRQPSTTDRRSPIFPPVLLPNTAVARHPYPPGRSLQSTSSQRPNHIHSNHIYTKIHFWAMHPFWGPLGAFVHHQHTPHQLLHIPPFFSTFFPFNYMFSAIHPFFGPLRGQAHHQHTPHHLPHIPPFFPNCSHSITFRLYTPFLWAPTGPSPSPTHSPPSPTHPCFFPNISTYFHDSFFRTGTNGLTIRPKGQDGTDPH
jgi:hypothetical protein